MEEKTSRLSSWKQTRIYSCGPACLMTALNEYGGSELSEKREMELWRKVRHLFFLGSTPAYLAECAAGLGLSARLMTRNPPGPEKIPGRTLVNRLLHRYLLGVYGRTAGAYRKKGRAAAAYRKEAEILRLLEAGQNAKAIFLIADQDEIFHFILVRRVGAELWVMDPAYGANTPFSEGGFLAAYGPSFLGYCVLLTKTILL